MNGLHIRPMKESDIDAFLRAFAAQGWEKPREVLECYYDDQCSGRRKVFVAEVNGVPAGYATLLPNDPHGPFANRQIPVVNDFNVFLPFGRQGIGSAIMDAVEAEAKKTSDVISLGVGLHSGYGTAQRMYIKRGYVPDGSGVWYEDKPLAPYAPCQNDDGLVLYLSKRLV